MEPNWYVEVIMWCYLSFQSLYLGGSFVPLTRDDDEESSHLRSQVSHLSEDLYILKKPSSYDFRQYNEEDILGIMISFEVKDIF